jgi:SAM-dependent methyltransferase
VTPTERFAGLADDYERYRPSYPAAAIDAMTAGLSSGAVVIDIGCGTGIATRLLAARGLVVIGVEPNDDMRSRALAAGLDVRLGTAEATGLPAACADLVLAAQAFHWFRPSPALAEFHRLLRPGGRCALIWNEPDDADPATAAYRAALRSTTSEPRLLDRQSDSGLALMSDPHFHNAQRLSFSHEQSCDRIGLLGRAASVSYAPRDAEGAARLESMLSEVFAEHAVAGRITLRYETVLTIAERAAGAFPG